MASRKEQKEQLRREREEREAVAKAAERRRRRIGYGIAGVLGVAAVVVVAVLLLSGGDSGKAKTGGSVLPTGGSVPKQAIEDLDEAVRAAGGELKSAKAKSRDHTEDLSEQIRYESSPPMSGKHFAEAAADGSYEQAPDVKTLVHALEHGRILIWFKKDLPREARTSLKALFDEDPYQMILVPDETGMTYDVAVTAWNADPQPLGTGRLLGFPTYNEKIFDAIRAFKDEHRSAGPEAAP